MEQEERENILRWYVETVIGHKWLKHECAKSAEARHSSNHSSRRLQCIGGVSLLLWTWVGRPRRCWSLLSFLLFGSPSQCSPAAGRRALWSPPLSVEYLRRVFKFLLRGD